MSKQILIIPDVHGRTFWKEPVRNIDKFEKVIFLGDYLDPYPSEGIYTCDAIIVFKEIIALKEKYPEKVILLLGNHDVHYLWFRDVKPCTRFSLVNVDQILDMFYENQKLFKVAHSEVIGPKVYLFSHAGITNKWLTSNGLKPSFFDIDDFLNGMKKTEGGRKQLAQVGMSRMGKYPSGGPMWADFVIDMNGGDEKVDYLLYQIVGHTRSRTENRKGPHAACLDCMKAWVMDCESGNLNVLE